MRKQDEQTSVGKIIGEKRVFDHPFFAVNERVVRTPEGKEREPQLLWDRGDRRFVIVVATDIAGNFVLVEESKFGQMKRMISAPTGAVKGGELPVAAAIREFSDETGYVLEGLTQLNTGPIVDFADKTDGGEHIIFSCFRARKNGVPKNSDQRVIIASSEETWAYATEGRMPAMTIAAIAFYFRFR